MSAKFTEEIIESYWKNGKTLPLEATDEYPFDKQKITEDNGYNVLIDLAHQCGFSSMWKMSGILNDNGYRYIGSHSCLDLVLKPNSEVRVRLKTGETEDKKIIRPFGMWKTCEFNSIFTTQSNMDAQDFLPEELDAVDDFLQDGGGLLIAVGFTKQQPAEIDMDLYNQWPLRKLLKKYDADITTEQVMYKDTAHHVIDPGDWEVTLQSDDGKPLICRRTVGKGRITLISSTSLIFKAVHGDIKDLSEGAEQERLSLFKEIMEWVNQGKPPVGGTTRIPTTYAGGASIYPEIEKTFGKIVVYYTKNQKQSVLDIVENDYPAIQKQLYKWLPSPEPVEPMFILMCSGTGGGWAVNAFLPKENGIIAYNKTGIVGIFGHEMGHTMSGPRNKKGERAASWFGKNQGEAHAGWLQGKIMAMFTDDKEMRDCNKKLFDDNEDFIPFDLADEEQRGGKIWTQLWWLWQRLDETYGTTWYARWRWVQYTRWMNDPKRELSSDEMIEDMSIAVGEDLFAFLKTCGTTVGKERFSEVEFMGETISLPVANIAIQKLGPATLDNIGDYTKPASQW